LTEIERGRPTLSPEADELARRIVGLLGSSEHTAFGLQLESWVAHSARWSEWVQQDDVYLADLDPGAIEAIVITLVAYEDVLRARTAPPTDD
jgi:hypothetical protein